jgi:hypothetical protein
MPIDPRSLNLRSAAKKNAADQARAAESRRKLNKAIRAAWDDGYGLSVREISSVLSDEGVEINPQTVAEIADPSAVQR